MTSSPDDRRSPNETQPAEAKPAPLQFGLRTMFAATAVVAGLTAGGTAAGVAGMFLAMAAMGLVVGLWADFTSRWNVRRWCIAGILVGLLGLLFTPAVQTSRGGRRSLCAYHLNSLATVLKAYERRHESLPPIYTVDRNGVALASWRTLILPRMEQEPLFLRYRLDEPWDGPNNATVVQSRVHLFQCPADFETLNNPAHTSYVAVVGPGTAWRAGQGVKLSETTDDPADTILLVEMKDSGIHWAEPRDLELNNLPPGVTLQNLAQALSNHAGGFNAAFADGHVEFIRDTIPWQQLQALFTIAGGERLTATPGDIPPLRGAGLDLLVGVHKRKLDRGYCMLAAAARCMLVMLSRTRRSMPGA